MSIVKIKKIKVLNKSINSLLYLFLKAYHLLWIALCPPNNQKTKKEEDILMSWHSVPMNVSLFESLFTGLSL